MSRWYAIVGPPGETEIPVNATSRPDGLCWATDSTMRLPGPDISGPQPFGIPHLRLDSQVVHRRVGARPPLEHHPVIQPGVGQVVEDRQDRAVVIHVQDAVEPIGSHPESLLAAEHRLRHGVPVSGCENLAQVAPIFCPFSHDDDRGAAVLGADVLGFREWSLEGPRPAVVPDELALHVRVHLNPPRRVGVLRRIEQVDKPDLEFVIVMSASFPAAGPGSREQPSRSQALRRCLAVCGRRVATWMGFRCAFGRA